MNKTSRRLYRTNPSIPRPESKYGAKSSIYEQIIEIKRQTTDSTGKYDQNIILIELYISLKYRGSHISKTLYFVLIQSGLSIGVKIMMFCSKKFFLNFDQKGGPLRKKSQFLFTRRNTTIYTPIESPDWIITKYIALEITIFLRFSKKAILKNRVFGLKKYE